MTSKLTYETKRQHGNISKRWRVYEWFKTDNSRIRIRSNLTLTFDEFKDNDLAIAGSSNIDLKGNTKQILSAWK